MFCQNIIARVESVTAGAVLFAPNPAKLAA